MPISAIIPTYRNPEYLDLCLQSAVENKVLEETEIIVIVDGFCEESRAVIDKYTTRGVGFVELPENMGMAHAINTGVWLSKNKVSFIVNDDQVFPKEWDLRLEPFEEEILLGAVITVNQIEPTPSIFGFPLRDFGRTVEEFQYDNFMKEEQSISHSGQLDATGGRIFPFLISKKEYMIVGGFDSFYESPFYVDVDFFLKLELNKKRFYRTHVCHLYHFGSKATKNGPEGKQFIAGEYEAGRRFLYKWGYGPAIVKNVIRANTKLPSDKTIRGIDF